MNAASIVAVASTLACAVCAALAVLFARRARRYRVETDLNVQQARLLQLNPGAVLERAEGIRAAMTEAFEQHGYAPATARNLSDVAFESWLDHVVREEM